MVHAPCAKFLFGPLAPSQSLASRDPAMSTHGGRPKDQKDVFGLEWEHSARAGGRFYGWMMSPKCMSPKSAHQGTREAMQARRRHRSTDSPMHPHHPQPGHASSSSA